MEFGKKRDKRIDEQGFGKSKDLLYLCCNTKTNSL